VVAINQIFPHQRRQIILICTAKLAIFDENRNFRLKDFYNGQKCFLRQKISKKLVLYSKNAVHLQLQI